MPTLKPTPEGGFSFQNTIQFERLDTMGSNSANLVFRFDDDNTIGLHLPRSDLIAVHAAISDWLRGEPTPKDEPQSKH
jgi:hypothetical protein